MRLEIRGINRVRAKGRVYLYHRASGKRLKAAADNPGALAAELAAIEAALARKTETKAKTFGNLWAAYRASSKWLELMPRTRRDYDRIALYLLDHIAEAPLHEFDAPAVVAIQAQTFREKKRHLANYAVQVMSVAFEWGRLHGWIADNPARRVPKIKKAKGAPDTNRPWTADELRAVMAAAPARLRLALELMFWTGLRTGEVLRLPWGAWEGDYLAIRQPKTGKIKRVEIAPALLVLLQEAAAEKASPIIITTKAGSPYTESGFRAVFNPLVQRLEKAGALADGCTLHGLRSTVAAWLAEGGENEKSIQSMLGQTSPAMAQHYARAAEMARRTGPAVAILDQRRNESAKLSAKPGAK